LESFISVEAASRREAIFSAAGTPLPQVKDSREEVYPLPERVEIAMPLAWAA
jgi:hypothetical protein